jgi:hypothetical protein
MICLLLRKDSASCKLVSCSVWHIIIRLLCVRKNNNKENRAFDTNGGYFSLRRNVSLFVRAKTKRSAMCSVCDIASYKSTSYSAQKWLFSALKSKEDSTETSYHITEVIGITWLITIWWWNQQRLVNVYEYLIFVVCLLHVSATIISIPREVYCKGYITKCFEPMRKCKILSFKLRGLDR